MSSPAENNIERRQNFRIDMEEEIVDILWRDNEGQAHKVKSICVDFSKGGLRLEHDFAILPNTEVSFCFHSTHPESKEVKAKVVRCVHLTNGKFSIGLQMM